VGRSVRLLLGCCSLAGCGSSSGEGLFESGAIGGSGSGAAQSGAGGVGAVGKAGRGPTASDAGASSGGISAAGGSTGIAGTFAAAGSSAGRDSADSGSGGASTAGTGAGGSPPVTCPTGQFSGPWNGQYSRGGLPTSTTGTLNLSVDASGAISGAWTGTAPVDSSADIVGVIDCATGALTATIDNGTYSGFFPLPISGTFSGELTGEFDPVSGSFTAGVWTVTESNGIYGGSGTWSAG
jgi:hypothetical protein